MSGTENDFLDIGIEVAGITLTNFIALNHEVYELSTPINIKKDFPKRKPLQHLKNLWASIVGWWNRV